MERIRARNVVVGAGVAGAAAAYHLARRGEPVLLVEQFDLGHKRGSSHGATRIIRHSYADPIYAGLMPRVYRMWTELEAEVGKPLMVRTGGVSVSPPGVDYVARVAASLEAVGVPHRRMSAGEWCWRNLPFGFDLHSDVVFEPDAGILHASLARGALLNRATHARAQFLKETPIRRIDFEATRPTLIGDDGTVIEAERLVVAAGPWVGSLIPALRSKVEVTRQTVLYFEAPDPIYSLGRLPIFIWMGADETQAFYGMPDTMGRGVKVARHWGPAVDPGSEDQDVIDPAYIEQVRGFLRGFFKLLASAPLVETETCLYTMTRDEEFLVGPLNGREDVVVASACSGHGFKFGILVGEVVAGWVMGVPVKGETERWAVGLKSVAN